MRPLHSIIPRADADSARYWAATVEGRLELPRCGACTLVIAYPRARCPRCHAGDLTWERMAGTGSVYSFTVVHRPSELALARDVPYVVALVDLDEGARLMTNIVGCAPDRVRIGMPVRVRFERVAVRAALPLFEPILPDGSDG
jgi:uncharacterized OB-fold protein